MRMTQVRGERRSCGEVRGQRSGCVKTARIRWKSHREAADREGQTREKMSQLITKTKRTGVKGKPDEVKNLP